MQVYFQNVLVLGYESLVSKAGNPFGVLQFLDVDCSDVYRVACFGSDQMAVAGSLHKGSNVGLAFDVTPDRNGSIRLELCGMGQAHMMGDLDMSTLE